MPNDLLIVALFVWLVAALIALSGRGTIVARALLSLGSAAGILAALFALPDGTAAVARKTRDPRLPNPGTLLKRVHGKKEHVVKVLQNDFEYKGKRHRSLSAIAREITGTSWNGFLFFGLAKRETGKEA